MASSTLGVLCGAGLALGIGLAVLAPTPTTDRLADTSAISGELEARLRETTVGVHSRADTLANLPSLQASVATDAETVRDQTQTELAFRPNKGETITIGQVPREGAPTVLLVLPGDASAEKALDQNGPRAQIRGGKLMLVEVISVMPKDAERAKMLRGALAISWPVDVASVAQKLDAAGAAARLERDGETMLIGAHPIGNQDRARVVPLASEAARGLKLSIVSAPPVPAGLPLRPIGVAIAIVSVIGGAFLLRGGRRVPSVGTAPTMRAGPPSNNMGAAEIGVGSTIQDTYEITRLLGQGGMGAVWEAQHLRLPDKRVAIKLLIGDNVEPELFARFRREAEITSKLGHPNIVGVLDFNTLPTGAPYIVLELLIGESLAARLHRDGALPLDKTLDIAQQIGSALNAAHRAEIVHRDLKPDNVFLVPVEGGGEQVKVLDFGISKMRGGVSMKTQESAMLGTPQYMSPEQANGRNSEVDARSDVWALSAIVYEMLTGDCAFAGNSLPAVMVKIVVQPSPSLAGLPGVPDQVAAAVAKALAKEPGERFPDVRSFVAALTGAPLVTGTRDAEPTG